MQLQCENCQKNVNNSGELDGCRSCSKPPPPPSPAAKPSYEMVPSDGTATLEQALKLDAEQDEFSRFKRDSRPSIPPMQNIGDLLRAKAGHPPAPRPAPAPAILREDYFDDEEHPLYI